MRNVGILYDKKVGFNRKKPFIGRVYNRDYSLLLSMGYKYNLNIYLAPFTAYKNKVFKQAWQFNGQWQKVKNVRLNAILDKVDGNSGFALKRIIDKQLPLINRYDLDLLCTDKWLLYKRWPRLMPKTALGTDVKTIKKIKSQLLIVKPRTGASGKGIYFIKHNKFKPISNDYIVQELIMGGNIFNINGPHDYRVIMGNNKPIFSTIRVPFRKKYISNVGQGGKEYYYPPNKIPRRILKIVQRIDNNLNKYKPRLYSTDFIVAKNNKPYIIELNSRPGLTHYGLKKIKILLYQFILKNFDKILKNKCRI